MAADKRVIVCTGPPGSGRDDLLLKMRERAGFNYYHTFEYLLEEARFRGTNLTKLNILDFYDSSPDRMEEFHKAAIEKICAQIEKRGGVNIVSTPYHFEWKGNRFHGLHPEEVLTLNPDLFVIVFDDILRVRGRLERDTQWQEHKFTLSEIANWRREEISGVYGLSRQFTPQKEVQLVAYENGPELLKEIIFSVGKEKVYLSHPITGESPGFFKKITRFGDSLSEYYIVFDPYMIKDWEIVEAWRAAVNEAIEKGEPRPTKLRFSMTYKDGPIEQELDALELEAGIKNMRFQIIDTDYKIIENSAMVVVYHPRASISAGVMCEMVYAKALGRLVYVYYPYEPSPFFEWYATRIFTEEGELRDFLIKESKLTGQTPLDIYSGRPPGTP
jgi:adenylate kinase